MSRVRVFGPIFRRGLSRQLIDRAIAKTVTEGRKIVADATPVRTGNLQAGWKAEERVIFNTVPYCIYVERRRQMVGRSIPQIEALLEQNIAAELKGLE